MKLLEQLREMAGAAAFDALVAMGALADSYGAGLYVVGGAVRDMFLGRSGAPDLDLVVEGDAPAFAFAVAGKFGGSCVVHKLFGTASVELPGEQPLRFDFATARTETYRKPGVLPTVSPAKSIHDDLSRRDFSYNAMAMRICGGGGAGELVDPHGGREDLEAGLTRVLHAASFEDDPTRVLRGVRFNARFGFGFEHGTASLASRAVEEHRLGGVSGARVRKEIRASLEEACRADIIEMLDAMDVFETIVPGLRPGTALMRPDVLAGSIAVVEGGPVAREVQVWVAYLLASLEAADRELLEGCARRLALSKREAAPLLDNLMCSGRERAALADPHTADAEVEELLSAAEPETLAVLHAAAEPGIARERIERFVNSEGVVRLEISGKDLLSMGHEPSAVFGEVLREVRRAKIEGKVNNRRQELALARKLMDRWA